jgi:hypothetical protein
MVMPIINQNLPKRCRLGVLNHVLRHHSIHPDHAVLEFGVFKGASLNVIAKDFRHKTVYGFDSFEGLPEPWVRPDKGFEAGHFTLDGIPPKVEPNVRLYKGWFKDTIGPFKRDILKDTPIGLLHVDCDLYSSTVDILQGLKDNLHETIIVFDDLINHPNWEQGEAKALYELLEEGEFHWQWIGCYTPAKPSSKLSSGLGMPKEAAAIKLFRKK